MALQRLVPAPGLGVEYADETAYVAPLPDGPITVLEGIAALIWQEACDGDPNDLVERVATYTGGNAAGIRNDVEAFVGRLVEQGLLRSAD